MAKAMLQRGISTMSQQGLALIDTGATSTAIDDQVAQHLKLPVVDKGAMVSASHNNHPCNLYPVQFTLSGQISLEAPKAMGVNLAPQGFIAIIGRDVLRQCVMVYNGHTGSISLSI